MKLKQNVAVSETGFIFDPSNGESYSLNPIAVEILNMIKEDADSEEIKKEILKKYDVDAQTFEHNYFEFVGMLEKFNLIENN
jgi:hypothetical protein